MKFPVSVTSPFPGWISMLGLQFDYEDPQGQFEKQAVPPNQGLSQNEALSLDSRFKEQSFLTKD